MCIFHKIYNEGSIIKNAGTVIYMYYRYGKMKTVSGIVECNIANILYSITNVYNMIGIVVMPLNLFDDNIYVVQAQNFNRNAVVQ